MGTKKSLVGDLILFLVLYLPKDPNRRVVFKIPKILGTGGSLISKNFQKIGRNGGSLGYH
jgi:hypothetical protein